MLRSAEAAQRNRADELQARVDEFEAKREELVEAYSAMVHEVERLRALEHELGAEALGAVHAKELDQLREASAANANWLMTEYQEALKEVNFNCNLT